MQFAAACNQTVCMSWEPFELYLTPSDGIVSESLIRIARQLAGAEGCRRFGHCCVFHKSVAHTCEASGSCVSKYKPTVCRIVVVCSLSRPIKLATDCEDGAFSANQIPKRHGPQQRGSAATSGTKYVLFTNVCIAYASSSPSAVEHRRSSWTPERRTLCARVHGRNHVDLGRMKRG